MKTVEAVHMGCCVNPAGRGEVTGCFSAGCYLRMEQGLYMLHDVSYGAVPFGIAVEDVRALLAEAGPVPGSSVTAGEGDLTFESPALRVRLAPRVERPGREISSVDTALAAECILQILDSTDHGCVKGLCAEEKALRRGETPQFDDLYCRVAARGLAKFLPALAENDAAGMEAGLMGFIGLGLGLTPSMDDFLTGFLYASHVLAEAGRGLTYLTALPALVKTVAEARTSEISAAYLCAAADNDYFSIVEDTAIALLRGDKETARDILRVGSNSGADILTGMYFAFSA